MLKRENLGKKINHDEIQDIELLNWLEVERRLLVTNLPDEPYLEYMKYIFKSQNREENRIWENLLKCADYQAPVAFLFYKVKNLSKQKQYSYSRIYSVFKKRNLAFEPKNILDHVIQHQIVTSWSKDTWDSYYKDLSTIGMVSYGFSEDQFKKYAFANIPPKKLRVPHSELTLSVLSRLIRKLVKEKKIKEAFMFKAMFCLTLKPWDVLLLAHEHFAKNGDKYIYMPYNRDGKYVEVNITKALYDLQVEVMKQNKSKNVYKLEMRPNAYREEVEGNFIFQHTKKTLEKAFRNKFRNYVQGFSHSAKYVHKLSVKTAPKGNAKLLEMALDNFDNL